MASSILTSLPLYALLSGEAYTARTSQLGQDLSAPTQVLARGYEVMCACCLMELNFGVICHVAAEN